MTSLFYDWKSYLKPFGRGGAVKLWQEKADGLNQLMNKTKVICADLLDFDCD